MSVKSLKGKQLMVKSPVNYWMHANMLTLNGQKMSKSTGNSILPAELFTGDNDFMQKAFLTERGAVFYDAGSLSFYFGF